ncbi:MAG TPA: hypothetical protein VFA75_07995 [Nevskia sp.]|nr:hypothetical protein [Nevskia sp.]
MTIRASKAAKTSHAWSKEALLAKAQRYAQEMLSNSRDDWRFGLTSTFVLEFLARAALANISPALLADSKSWNNLYFSLGHTPNAPKFIPKSIDITEVFGRLRDTIPTFTTELEGFAAQHISRRNEELHAGSTPFDGLSTSWLARFYETCTVLLASIGEDLSLLIGDKESKVATKLIAASKDESAKAVAKAIAAHKTVWDSKSPEEQKKLARKASVWATRQAGHRVVCPACSNEALVSGSAISEPLRKLDGDLIVEAQEYLPSKFECIACQLKIAGLSQLSASGLGATYKSTSTYDAAEYYAPEDEHPGFDDDNNEY